MTVNFNKQSINSPKLKLPVGELTKDSLFIYIWRQSGKRVAENVKENVKKENEELKCQREKCKKMTNFKK